MCSKGQNSVEGGGGVTEGGRLLGPKFLGPGVVDPVTSFPGFGMYALATVGAAVL